MKKQIKNKTKKKKKHSPSALTCCKDSRPCPTVSQSQLDAPVTQDTRYFASRNPHPLQSISTLLKLIWVFCWSYLDHNVRNCTFLSRIRSAGATAQSDQTLRGPSVATLDSLRSTERSVKTPIRLRGCAVWSESSLGALIIRNYLYSCETCDFVCFPVKHVLNVFEANWPLEFCEVKLCYLDLMINVLSSCSYAISVC